ncbi:hypothetical protein GCM10023080_082320 [Streptomyces pseudoechinosporeus]
MSPGPRGAHGVRADDLRGLRARLPAKHDGAGHRDFESHHPQRGPHPYVRMYRSKYGHYAKEIIKAITSPEASSTTMRLVPR